MGIAEVMNLTTGRLAPVEEHPIYEEEEMMEVELSDSASDCEQIQESLSVEQLLNRKEAMTAMHQGSVEALRYLQQDMTPMMGALPQEQLALADDQEL